MAEVGVLVTNESVITNATLLLLHILTSQAQQRAAHITELCSAGDRYLKERQRWLQHEEELITEAFNCKVTNQAILMEKAGLEKELQTEKGRVQELQLRLLLEQEKSVPAQQPLQNMTAYLANIFRALQERVVDDVSAAECQRKLSETQQHLRALPGILKGNLNSVALEAAKAGNTQELSVVLNAGANVDAADESGRSLLSWASWNGHVPAVRLLLEKGATVDQIAPGWYKNTPMMAAAWNGHLVIVKLLMEYGSVLEHANDNGGTELIHAVMRGHLPIVKYLVEKGANINATSKEGKTVLQLSTPNVAEWLRTKLG